MRGAVKSRAQLLIVHHYGLTSFKTKGEVADYVADLLDDGRFAFRDIEEVSHAFF